MGKSSNNVRKSVESRPVDRIDVELLGLLENNARRSNKELAAAVGIAPSTCLERMRRLVEDGVIRGFHAELEPRALGIGLEAMISLRLRRHSHDQVESFWDHVLSVEEVLDVYHLAGESDFLVHVVVRDTDHLRHLAMNTFTTRDEVDQIHTSLIFRHRRNHQLPCFVDPEEG